MKIEITREEIKVMYNALWDRRNLLIKDIEVLKRGSHGNNYDSFIIEHEKQVKIIDNLLETRIY